MAMITMKRPGKSELQWFGLVILTLFTVIGALLWWRMGAFSGAVTSWGIGVGMALAYYAIRPLRLPMYMLWMRLVLPIGIVISHVLLAVIYFGVISPMALLMRAFGRDKLERRFVSDTASYWSVHDETDEPSHYLRQS